MIPAYYLIKWPYRLGCRVADRFRGRPALAVYCAGPLDRVVLLPVMRHLPPALWVSGNGRTARHLRSEGLAAVRYPVFPRVVIMARHAQYRFPDTGVFKVGFRHGAYHFKQFAGTAYYNAFDLYFMTSRADVEAGRKRGIRSARSAGFPKLDPAFDGTWNRETLMPYAGRAGLLPGRPTVLMTATWDRSGMSAVGRWLPVLPRLAAAMNVMVTVHPFTSRSCLKSLSGTPGVFLIREADTLPYLMLSDVVVGDTSSILAEACALNKPMVTFRVPQARRSLSEITGLLDRISIRIDDPGDLRSSVYEAAENPERLEVRRMEANALMFDTLDGRAGERAARMILNAVPELKRGR